MECAVWYIGKYDIYMLVIFLTMAILLNCYMSDRLSKTYFGMRKNELDKIISESEDNLRKSLSDTGIGKKDG